MTRHFIWVPIYLAISLLWGAPAQAQDWTTIGSDAQRSSWVRTDAKISIVSLSGPDFKFLWKRKLDNERRQLKALTTPVLVNRYIGYRGFRSLAFFGGSSGPVFAIDTDLNRVEWKKSLGAVQRGEGTLACPGGMTSSLTRPTSAQLPPLGGFLSRGRRSPARSGVGLPKEGAVTLAMADRPGSRPPSVTPASSRERPPIRSPNRGLRLVYALANDGLLHTLFVSNGDAYGQALKFLPPNANAQGLIVVDDVAYVATTNGCAAVADGVWALDLESSNVVSWESPGGGVVGLAGPAIGTDGTVYAATGSGTAVPSSTSFFVVALEAKTLKEKGRYELHSGGFTSSPVVVDYNSNDYLAVSAKDGAIHLFDGSNLGKVLDKTPGYPAAADFVSDALASWRDGEGTVWVLAPIGGPSLDVTFPFTNGEVRHGAIVAWKVVDKNGSPTLEPGWVSRDMVSPLPPIVVNGVVFAASSGRGQSSSPAVLYALDGKTGKTIWDSGDSITTFAHANALSSGGSTVYFSTHDSTLYAFGFPIEH